MRRRIAHGLMIVLSVVSLGAAQGPNSSESLHIRGIPPSSGVIKAAAKPVHGKPYQVGVASWYGEYFVGKPTASGEPYNMYAMTAAHPTLPIGTLVRVTNLRNGRAVTLRINDRGPIVPGRIIDLSYSAAQMLNFKSKGLQRVRIDVVPSETQTMASLRPLAF